MSAKGVPKRDQRSPATGAKAGESGLHGYCMNVIEVGSWRDTESTS